MSRLIPTLALVLVTLGCTVGTAQKGDTGETERLPVYTPLEGVEWAYVHDASLVGWEVWDEEALETEWESGVVMGLSLYTGLTEQEWAEDWSREGMLSPRIGDVDPERWGGALAFMWPTPGGAFTRIRASCDPEFGQETFEVDASWAFAEYTADATYLGETQWKYGPIQPTWEIELNLYEVHYTDPNGVERIAPHVGPVVGLSGTKCFPSGD